MEQMAPQQEDASVNGFNLAEVKAFLSRDAKGLTSYKVVDGPAAGNGRGGNGSGAWGAKRA